MTSTEITVRSGIPAILALGDIGRACLYVHGYHHIPTIGSAFLIQASISLAAAPLILVGGPTRRRYGAAVLAGGTLAAFVLSRTVGFFGFSKRGWEPSPTTRSASALNRQGAAGRQKRMVPRSGSN